MFCLPERWFFAAEFAVTPQAERAPSSPSAISPGCPAGAAEPLLPRTGLGRRATRSAPAPQSRHLRMPSIGRVRRVNARMTSRFASTLPGQPADLQLSCKSAQQICKFADGPIYNIAATWLTHVGQVAIGSFGSSCNMHKPALRLTHRPHPSKVILVRWPARAASPAFSRAVMGSRRHRSGDEWFESVPGLMSAGVPSFGCWTDKVPGA
jgi:hypothetical protein